MTFNTDLGILKNERKKRWIEDNIDLRRTTRPLKERCFLFQDESFLKNLSIIEFQMDLTLRFVPIKIPR
jgi:hypothetical protein